jgi:hypothetical protein
MLSPLYSALGVLGRKYGGAAGSPFLTGLVWAPYLDELTGNRVDPISAYDLVPTGAVKPNPRGPSGTVARFVAANSEVLVGASTMPADSNYTALMWCKLNAGANTHANEIITSGDGNFILRSNGLNPQIVGRGFSASTYWNSAETVAIGDWHLYAGWHDADNDLFGISVDARNATTVASGGANGAGAATAIGARDSTPTPTTICDADIGRGGVWSRVLSSAEILSIFNSGNGKAYADLTAGEKVGLVAYWDADETSGNRADSRGSYTLTDTNTVGSVTATPGAMRNTAALVNRAAGTYLRTSAVSIDFSAGLTASVWVRPTDKVAGDWQTATVLEKGHEWNYTYPFSISYSGVDSANKLYFIGVVANASAGTSQSHNYTESLPWSSYQGIWTHLCLTWGPDDSIARLYINGVVAGTPGVPLVGVPNNSVAQPISISYTTLGGAAQVTGAVDEPLVWNRKFTVQEVLDIFNSGVGRFHPLFT